MFGFGHQTSSAATQQQEQQRQLEERSKQTCKEELHKMHDASAEDAERIHKWLKDRCVKDKYLPVEFKRKLMEKARQLECFANMRAADKALHQAARLAAEEHMVERAQKLGEGRKYFSKACSLGADDDFRHAAQRLMDTIMLTGGVHKKGPTRAKPLDLAPKTPNRAKC